MTAAIFGNIMRIVAIFSFVVIATVGGLYSQYDNEIKRAGRIDQNGIYLMIIVAVIAIIGTSVSVFCGVALTSITILAIAICSIVCIVHFKMDCTDTMVVIMITSFVSHVSKTPITIGRITTIHTEHIVLAILLVVSVIIMLIVKKCYPILLEYDFTDPGAANPFIIPFVVAIATLTASIIILVILAAFGVDF